MVKTKEVEAEEIFRFNKVVNVGRRSSGRFTSAPNRETKAVSSNENPSIVMTIKEQVDSAFSLVKTREERKTLNALKQAFVSNRPGRRDKSGDEDEDKSASEFDKDDPDYMVEHPNRNSKYVRTLDQMKQILADYDNKCSYKTLAKRYYLPVDRDSGYQLIKRFRKYVQEGKENPASVQKEVNRRTLESFKEADKDCLSMNGRTVKQFAIEHAAALGQTKFKASEYWLHTFKTKNGIVSRHVDKITSKKSLDNSDKIKASIDDFRKNVIPYLIQKYDPSKLYNVDQVPLKEELSCNRTLTFQGQKMVQRMVQREDPSKHSLTINALIRADGRLPDKMYVCLREPNPPKNFWTQVAHFPDLHVVHSSSGIMSKKLITDWIKEDFLSSCDDESLIIWDGWRTYYSLLSLPEVVNKKLEVVVLPDKTTPELQPLDLYFNRCLKDFIRTASAMIRLARLDFPIGKRGNLLSLLNLTHNQFKADRYVDFLKESFYKAGLLLVHPDAFQTPAEYVFKNPELYKSRCNICPTIVRPFIRCSYCEEFLCFKHSIKHRH